MDPTAIKAHRQARHKISASASNKPTSDMASGKSSEARIQRQPRPPHRDTDGESIMVPHRHPPNRLSHHQRARHRRRFVVATLQGDRHERPHARLRVRGRRQTSEGAEPPTRPHPALDMHSSGPDCAALAAPGGTTRPLCTSPRNATGIQACTEVGRSAER